MSVYHSNVLVFIYNADLFHNWKVTEHNPAFLDHNSRYSFRLINGKTFNYVCDESQIRGRGPCDILLLDGWEHRRIEEKIININILLSIGSKLIGRQSCVNEILWNRFKTIENNYIFNKTHTKYQGWQFDSIINRFKLMDIY